VDYDRQAKAGCFEPKKENPYFLPSFSFQDAEGFAGEIKFYEFTAVP
jgi:hypothetical protein